MFLRILLVSLLFNYSSFAKEINFNKSIPEGNYFSILNTSFKKVLSLSPQFKIKIMNTGDSEKELYLGLKDKKTKDYWGQFTYKTKLQSGLNELIINTNRFVGERGSHRYERKIDRKNLTEAFIVFNPEKQTTNEKILLVSIEELNVVTPKLPKDTKLFYFGEIESQNYNFAQIIKSSRKYKKGDSGFESIELWRNRDSKIVPEALGKTISVTEASFATEMPEGTYNIELIWDEVGYWEIPFWTNRKVFHNGTPLLIEARSEWKDFLKDLYIFEDSSDKPFKSLMTKILKPNLFTVKHPGGKLNLRFEGDASAIALNSMLIYKKNNKSIKKFKKTLMDFYKNEFTIQYREIVNNNKTSPCKNPNKVFYFNHEARFRFCLNGKKGDLIKLEVFGVKNKLFRYEKSYQSLDLNHESYTLKPDRLIAFENEIVLNEDNETVEIKLFNLDASMKSFSIRTNKDSAKYNLKLIKLKNTFKELPVKIGFFGPSVVPFTYFEAKKKDDWLNKLNLKVESYLKKNNIDFVTDQNKVKLNYNKDYSRFNLALNPKAKQEAVYFYNTKEIKDIINENKRNSSQSSEIYQENLKIELGKLISANMNLIYLYSDEPSGYRNAVDQDYEKLFELRKTLPGFYLGGFGNLYDFKQAKKLYEAWDVGFYTDIPNKGLIKKLNNFHTSWGLYNLCAEIEAPLRICYGVILYKLYKSGIKTVIEWHLNSSQNYPYFDLDGREADIAFLKTNAAGDIFETHRMSELQFGLETFKKLINLDYYLNSRKTLGLSETEAQKWLLNLEKSIGFPLKPEIQNWSKKDLSKFYRVLDEYCEKLLTELF